MTATLLSICALMGACTDSAITQVKERKIASTDFTYGELFEKAKGCKSATWSATDDENGRKIVEGLCTTTLNDAARARAMQLNDEHVQRVVGEFATVWASVNQGLEKRRDYLINSADQNGARLTAASEQSWQALKEAQANVDQMRELSINDPAWSEVHSRVQYQGSGMQRSRLLQLRNAERNLAEVQQRSEHVEAERAGLSTVNAAKDGQVADLSAAIDGLNEMKADYDAAVAAVKDAMIHEARVHESLLSESELILRFRFRVNDHSAPDVLGGGWLLDGQPSDMRQVMLMGAATMTPDRLTKLIEENWTQRLVAPSDVKAIWNAFPFECTDGHQQGCVRKPARS
ncbi:MAG: hypothetical protein EON54_21595 [Alcaligenaceae bacterium]|nr:MAG: hypothetical protein EON54_21595 [Alcaligenaceae bacterium]